MPNVHTGRTLGEGIRTEAQFALEELDVVQECLVLSLLLDQLLVLGLALIEELPERQLRGRVAHPVADPLHLDLRLDLGLTADVRQSVKGVYILAFLRYSSCSFIE